VNLIKSHVTSIDPSAIALILRRSTMLRKINSVIRKEDGNDMIEYALLAAFISIVAIVALQAIGPLVNGIYQNIQAALGG
jgi:Flp pilus assembly pilin Flp